MLVGIALIIFSWLLYYAVKIVLLGPSVAGFNTRTVDNWKETVLFIRTDTMERLRCFHFNNYKRKCDNKENN